jgi:hypothetical protein
MVFYRTMWIGLAAATSTVAVYYSLLGAHTWLRSRWVLGPLPREAHQTLRRLLDVSRQGNGLRLMRLTLFYGGLGAFVIAIAAREWLGLLVAAAPFVMIAWMEIRTVTAPVALILGTSNHSSIKRQRTVKHRLSPLRVVSLLDVDVPFPRRAWSSTAASPRTSSSPPAPGSTSGGCAPRSSPRAIPGCRTR